MALEVDTATGSAHWASYLINGDASGLEDHEIALCDAWQERLGDWYVVSVADDEDTGESMDAYFSWSYGLHTGDKTCTGGSLLDYIVHKSVMLMGEG